MYSLSYDTESRNNSVHIISAPGVIIEVCLHNHKHLHNELDRIKANEWFL